MAEDGHVLSAKRGTFDIEKDDGQVDMKKVGLAKASTFPGFCAHHDTAMFRPVEEADAVLDPWNGFLLSFRAISYELAGKRAAIDANEKSRGYIDNGSPFEAQSAIQNYLHSHVAASKQVLERVEQWKALYDNAFVLGDLATFSMYGLTFKGVLPFAASGAFLPEFGFQGEELQRIDRGELTEHLALNVTQLGHTTAAVFFWTGAPDGPASKLVESFKAVPDGHKADALLILCIEHLENFYCRPSWWQNLPQEVSKRLHENMAGGMPYRHSDALVNPGVGAVNIDVARALSQPATA